MAKDVNIHLKTTGAARTKQQLDETGKSAKGVGDKTAEGAKTGARATEESTQKMTGMGRVLSSLKTQVLAFVGAWLGLQGVQRAISYIIEKLERVAQLQKQIYKEGLTLAEVGQALEIQTGTRGMQQFWTEYALKVQKAGAIASSQIVAQMLISMDIAFQQLGGIKAPRIQKLAEQFAPIVGATGLGPEEVGQFFKFAGVAGIQPTAESYKEFFSKILAAYRSSESQIFGQFITGLQKGGTAYMMGGGTLEETLSAFSAAVAVTANEQLAATLIERIARLSGGAYERPRKAIEKGLGVRWGELSMDERFRALLQYMEGLPESRRTEILTEQGFPPEIATEASKLVSPKAKRTLEATGEQVAAATSAMIEEVTRSYLDSMLAQQRQTEAKIAQKRVKAAPKFADWQIRLDEATAEFEDALSIGMDRWIFDSIEPHVIALKKMEQEIGERLQEMPKGPRRKELALLRAEILTSLETMTQFGGLFYTKGLASRRGWQYTERLKTILETPETPTEAVRPSPLSGEALLSAHQDFMFNPLIRPFQILYRKYNEKQTSQELESAEQQGPVSINYNFDNSMKFYPRFGPDQEPGPRFTQFG